MNTPIGPKTLAVIPARLGSTRFPGKMIAPLCGKPVVMHAYERALRAEGVSEAVIAVDDERIAEAVRPFDANVVMTSPDHPSGTDRIAEVAGQRPDVDIIVNVQGDEALIEPKVIDLALEALIADPEVPMSTVRHPVTAASEIDNPDVVKVVCDNNGRALYFSRWPIPYIRDEAERDEAPGCHWQHVGLYVYRREFLARYVRMPQTPLERLEKLEQLRVLENGYPIAVADTDYECVSVDTPQDLEAVRRILEGRKGDHN